MHAKQPFYPMPILLFFFLTKEKKSGHTYAYSNFHCFDFVFWWVAGSRHSCCKIWAPLYFYNVFVHEFNCNGFISILFLLDKIVQTTGTEKQEEKTTASPKYIIKSELQNLFNLIVRERNL